MRINGLILRATPSHGRVWMLEVFSEQLGRTSFSAIARQSTGFSPLCLIEAEVEQGPGLPCSRSTEILDTFAEIRSQPHASKAAFIIRAILEQCMPMRAPAEGTWRVVISLLETLPSFHDWKAAPLLLALTLFEHEGVSPQSLAEMATLTEESRKTAQHLLNSNEETWRKSAVSEELLAAALETIGVKCERGDLNPHEVTLTTTSK
jgi:recombinational DNA repair protein (RecF pathway)